MFSLGSRLWIFHPVQHSIRRNFRKVAAKNLEYPESEEENHHDLLSFLEYTVRIRSDPESTVYIGTHYEYTVKEALEKLSIGMDLKRMGGKSDCGIDLFGTWTVPSYHRPLKVLVQCKAYMGGPSQAREMEGAFVGAPHGWRGAGVLGFLVSQKTATKGTIEAIGRSRWPMGYVYCKPDGKVLQMLWNQKADEQGLAGIRAELKYVGKEASERVVVLTHRGQILGVV